MNSLIDRYRAADAGMIGAVTGLAFALVGVLLWGVVKISARISGTVPPTDLANR